MTYEEKDFSHLFGTTGFSNKLLQTHFNLYSGYVKNTNKLTKILKKMIQEGKTATPEFSELKRRFGWEFSGMRLHELYFENMSKDKKTLPENSPLAQQMAESLGSVAARMDTFLSVGSMRGIGWVVMYYDPILRKLFCQWINEHDVGHLPGCVPLLVMDVFEHAFIMDYEMDRGAYIKSFLGSINWDIVQQRFEKAKR
jgi:superoxide dismutase, Fe-Mn family